jgi:hypothetical protein
MGRPQRLPIQSFQPRLASLGVFDAAPLRLPPPWSMDSTHQPPSAGPARIRAHLGGVTLLSPQSNLCRPWRPSRTPRCGEVDSGHFSSSVKSGANAVKWTEIQVWAIVLGHEAHLEKGQQRVEGGRRAR